MKLNHPIRKISDLKACEYKQGNTWYWHTDEGLFHWEMDKPWIKSGNEIWEIVPNKTAVKKAILNIYKFGVPDGK